MYFLEIAVCFISESEENMYTLINMLFKYTWQWNHCNGIFRVHQVVVLKRIQRYFLPFTTLRDIR